MDRPDFRSGFVAIIGKPNTGKSTLMNRILGERLSITSSKPQTTRYAIKGILNRDDCREWRPGTVACDEEGIWHPFVEAGMGKKDIRALARDLGLPVWNKPSSACLASRIPYGQPLTRQTLLMVEAAEDLLKSLGFGQLRVRADGKGARNELEKQEMERALNKADVDVDDLGVLWIPSA